MTSSAHSRTRSANPSSSDSGPKATAFYASDLARSTAKPTNTSATAVQPDAESASLELSPFDPEMPYEHRAAMALKLAGEAFAKTGSWVVFYREILGCKGVVWKLYPDPVQRQHFETTPEFAELLEIMTSIRSQDTSKATSHEPERMVTIRLPRSMHATVVQDAEALDLTINNYCLTKLLQPADKRFTPLEPGPKRGRKPGPQLTAEKIASGEITMQRVKVKTKSKTKAKPKAKAATKKRKS